MGFGSTLSRKLMLSDRVVARKDPVWFSQRILCARPWGKQQEILRALQAHDYVAVRSCNGSGKTFTAALATIWWLCAHDEALVVTTAPSDRQVRELLWREIRHLHRRNGEMIGGKLTMNRLEFSEKRFGYGFSSNSTERFQGFHSENMLVIVDEASGVEEYVFDALLGSMTSENAKMLMIGNPSSLAGTFYDAFHKKRKRWTTIHISAFDTPAFQDHRGEGAETVDIPAGLATPKWAQMIADQRGEQSAEYQFRVLGEFPDEADDTLIALRLVEAAVDREVFVADSGDTVMGVDVARFGSDQTVSVVRRGSEVLDVTAFGRSDLMGTTGRIIDTARRFGVVTMHIDEVGLGAGVLDRVRELKSVNAIGVNGASKPRDRERYLNLRAEMYSGLKQRFMDGDISIPDDAELISQLASLMYSYTSRGQLQIESKDQIRSSGRQSPDKADALALAFATDADPNPFMIWI